MSEKELSFEELTGTSSVDEWQQENTDAELSKVSAKAQEQLDLEKEIKDLEEQLKETKSRHRAVSELELPEAMQEANLAEIVLTNGSKISVKPFYKGHISEEHRVDAMAVHPQTLNAFIKEQITGGNDIPSDIFGIYVGSRANIK